MDGQFFVVPNKVATWLEAFALPTVQLSRRPVALLLAFSRKRESESNPKKRRRQRQTGNGSCWRPRRRVSTTTKDCSASNFLPKCSSYRNACRKLRRWRGMRPGTSCWDVCALCAVKSPRELLYSKRQTPMTAHLNDEFLGQGFVHARSQDRRKFSMLQEGFSRDSEGLFCLRSSREYTLPPRTHRSSRQAPQFAYMESFLHPANFLLGDQRNQVRQVPRE